MGTGGFEKRQTRGQIFLPRFFNGDGKGTLGWIADTPGPITARFCGAHGEMRWKTGKKTLIFFPLAMESTLFHPNQASPKKTVLGDLGPRDISRIYLPWNKTFFSLNANIRGPKKGF